MKGSQRRPLNSYLLAQATQFAAGGMMSVLFPWLIVNVLHETQIRVGIAQFLANAPFFLLILIAGAVADGRDLRVFVPRIQLAMALIPICLALTISFHFANFFSVTMLLVAMGILGSFATPARDAILSHVTPHDLGLARSAATTVAATFGGQVVGTLCAASAGLVGAVPLLAIQSALLVTAAVITARLQLVTPFTLKTRSELHISKIWGELADGFAITWRHEKLRTIIVYLILGAPLFNGVFLVGLPLMVRDVYHGSSAMLSFVFTAFLIGLTISSFLFSRMPPVERPGRLVLLLSPNNIFVFAAAHFSPPYPVFVALMLWWGLTSGIAMAVTRGMVQVAAPHTHRARVLSMLQFANIAGGLPGSLLFGALAQAYGILNALLLIPLAVTVLWLSFRFGTGLWGFSREPASL